MSSAGRAANSNGCVLKPKEHATGLIGFAAQIRRSSLIGNCAMETAEHREPCEIERFTHGSGTWSQIPPEFEPESHLVRCKLRSKPSKANAKSVEISP